jgi:hypothetical protein
MPTTRRSMRPGPTARGREYGRTRLRRSPYRTAYGRVGGYRADLPHAADWDMWTRLAANGPIVFVDEVLAVYRRHNTSDSWPRIRTGANVRERVTAISVVSAYVAPNRRALTTRKALAYSVVFAARTALSLVKAGEWSAAGRQAYEAVRCGWLMPGGVPVHEQSIPAAR